MLLGGVLRTTSCRQLRAGSESWWASPWASSTPEAIVYPGPAATAFVPVAEGGPGFLQPVPEEDRGLSPQAQAQIHQDREWAGDRQGVLLLRMGRRVLGGLGLGPAVEGGTSGFL